ncbi:hypothetical protein F4679DRAFT_578936 [Xylaria curta]|nr:hypothetical protein F4679DRAFT_578936 [Xylaria curta]
MPFVPAARDLNAYQMGGTRLRFSLGGLCHYIAKRHFENALQSIPGCTGLVIVYWPAHEPRFSGQLHGGWCHVLCSDVEQKNQLMCYLREARLDPQERQVCRVDKARKAISDFSRIVRVQISGQPAPAAASTSTHPTTSTSTTHAPLTATSASASTALKTTPAHPAETEDTVMADEESGDAVANLVAQRAADKRAWWESCASIRERFQEVLEHNAKFPFLHQSFREDYSNVLNLIQRAEDLWGKPNVSAPAPSAPPITVRDEIFNEWVNLPYDEDFDAEVDWEAENHSNSSSTP